MSSQLKNCPWDFEGNEPGAKEFSLDRVQRVIHFKFPGTGNPKACQKKSKEAKTADFVKHGRVSHNPKTN